MNRRVIFWGGTGQAKVLADCARQRGLEILAVFDNDPAVPPPLADVPILYGKAGFLSWLDGQSDPHEIGFALAIGGHHGDARMELHQFLASHGLQPVTLRHPTAFVAESARLGDGCQILANASICVEARLGRQCIVNTGAVVDHECRLGDGVHVAPGATLAGCVTVGDLATVYSGATILPRVTIGTGAVVGAGAVVLEDVPAHVTVAGNPARIIQSRVEAR